MARKKKVDAKQTALFHRQTRLAGREKLKMLMLDLSERRKMLQTEVPRWRETRDKLAEALKLIDKKCSAAERELGTVEVEIARINEKWLKGEW